ncbi:hypothetical protein GVN20_05655 [Runella sp. CRIBMP]|uniref:hypothetical protein n=1 Tax=Runella sp. CRIBMP TaxID=2683261 RepID=UPI0014126DCA|nr:hypothetical protein [Runella sp. CRIBMP]NBB18835.1 hypothetical protein [Runella sp. CRIBMP]
MAKTHKDNALEQHIEQSLATGETHAEIVARRFYDDFDDIYRYYHDPTGKLELSGKQKAQLSRWRWIREWLLQNENDTDREVILAIKMEYELSEKQAYIDLKNTKRFFASMEPVQKEFEKIMMIERLKKQYKRLKADGSIKAEAVAAKVEELLMKVMGLAEPEMQMPVPVVVEIKQVFQPSILGVDDIPEDRLAKMLKAFGQKKEEERRREIEDVSFEMILNNEQPPKQQR